MKIKFIVKAARWFDKVNGNTYFSVKMVNNETGETMARGPFYGYGDAYRLEAIKLMAEAEWIGIRYIQHPYLFERENYYPIFWDVSDGLKREMVENSKV